MTVVAGSRVALAGEVVVLGEKDMGGGGRSWRLWEVGKVMTSEEGRGR